MNWLARRALMRDGWSVVPGLPSVLTRDGVDVGFSEGGDVDVTFPVGAIKDTAQFPAGTPAPAVVAFCAALHSTTTTPQEPKP